MSNSVLRVAAFVLLLGTPSLAFAAPPNATTTPATALTTSSAVLNGTGTPNGEATVGWFRISASSPGTCNDTFGTRVPATSGTDLGTGLASVAYSITTTGLTPGVTYYFCSIVQNASGTAFGSILSFTVPSPPAVTTTAASAITSSGATLEGTANPFASVTTGWFRFATSNPGTCNDTFGTRAPTSGGSALGMGTSPVAYTRSIGGLAPSTTYYYCAIASSSFGTSFGSVLSFTTSGIAPSVSTSSPTLLTGTTAQLNGSANPNGDATTGWFRYSTASPGTCNDTFGTRAPASGGSALGAGSAAAAYSMSITGLAPATTYYYCAIASNSTGTSSGAVVAFTTPTAPTVATAAATSITSTSATLNGSGVPNRAPTTGYYRYGTTSPGTCNDTFGSRAPTTGGTSLGSGTSSQTFPRSVTGLSPATTYYFCAIAENGEGTAFGSVLSFTTTAAPSVTTHAATMVTATSATLNGDANPNGATSTGWFRYATVDPGTCNDTFGTRAPSSSGTGLAAGTAVVPFSRATSVLLPSTTYYFCAIANNASGTSFGDVLSFTTPAAAPTVSTNGATLVTGTTAQLNGSADPRGDATTGWFRFATASPGTCNDTFGTRAPASGGAALGSANGTVPFAQGITGLTPATTYWFCAIAGNGVGTTFGSVQSFVTPSAPSVVTSAATSISSTAATLNGSGIANRTATTGYFRYATTSPGTCNDTFGSRAPTTGGSSLGSGTSSMTFARSISGLSPATTYYFCAIATNDEGIAFGSVLSFTTTAAPIVTTYAATMVTATSATLNGDADPNGAASTAWFRYAPVDPGTCNDSFGTRAPLGTGTGTAIAAGTTAVPFSRGTGVLLPSTTYYFCAIASNSFGTAFGDVLSFTTPAAAPIVSTNGATLLTGTTAQLNGSADPRGDATTGWFRYATASPGACNDTFGTRAPAGGGTALGSANGSVPFSQGLTGLTPATTYWFCAIAGNGVGTSFGAVQSFVTPSAPSVVTTAATSVTSTSVTLNGSGIANRAATTGYFRYATTSPGTCNDTFGSRAPTTGGSSLGSGTTSQTFSRSVTGLSPGTTYYYCAIATNDEGIALGSVLSFTTTAAPSVVTNAATTVTATSATLNGAANPNGATTTGWFRYATTSPGTCNDTFGTRAPLTSGGSALGMGSSDVAFGRLTGTLLPATTYYFCAIANNSFGTSFGDVLSFTTPAALPSVTTNGATLVTGATAQLNGSADPRGDATTGWFRYATASPGTCNDTFGMRAPASGGAALGSGNATVPFSQGITGLTPATTYYFCAIAGNGVGTSFGAVQSFVTPSAPTVTTLAATSITSTTASLNGSGVANRTATVGYFRYSSTHPGTCNDTFGSPTSTSSSLGSGTSTQAFSRPVSGLSPGTTYYYCAIATNAEGIAFGAVLSFTTTAAPTVVTAAATAITATSATANGTVNPNGASTLGWYRYATTSPGTCNDTFGTRMPTSGGVGLGSGTAPVALPMGLTGLLPATTYYFCAIANNSYGTDYGDVLSFTTPAAVPIVTTSTATPLTGTTATLRGTANPRGAETTGWFRYGTASPGACNDTFGTRAPTTGGTSLGAGNAAVAFTEAITGLTPATTYYYCAIASNAVGTTFGNVLSFVTPSAPTVTTSTVSGISNTAATLSGSGNPNRADTTGYFRYSLTDPGTCNDTFGSRAPTTGGTALGSGSASVAFSRPLSGLSPATTYYYCAIAVSSEGIAFGAVLTFTTLAPPTVATSAATLVSTSSATLNGNAIPNGNGAYGYFRYGTASPGVCNDTFGTRAPASSASDSYLGAGSTAIPYARAISGLLPGTAYYFCAIARNAYGTSFGTVFSFTTPSSPPAIATLAATGVTTSAATLNGSGTPNGAATTAWFRIDTTSPGSCNDTFGTRVPSSGGVALGAGTGSVAFSQSAPTIAPGTTYHYCAIGTNSEGITFGVMRSFTTPAAPIVATLAATPVTATSGTLNSSINPNGYATTAWFRYDTTSPGACNTTFGTATAAASMGSGTSATTHARPLAGLSPATTYYFCAIASSTIGTTLGEILSFTTPPTQPSVVTLAASGIAPDAAQLNASANPNGQATTGWFRYATTSPGACNDTFGTRTPASGGTALGAGNASAPFSASLTGLSLGTTYYFCAIASNGIGTTMGSVLSFTTTAAPTVTTSPATAVASTSATIAGSANPRLSATTGWLRYAAIDPGSCNDTFGTRAPASGGTALGSGSSAVGYSQALTGLSAGTTYYFCAIAQSAAGTGFGTVLSFTTPAAPSVITIAASAVTSTGAALEGTANPNLATATGWFRYATTSPGTCNDTFGTRAPASGGTALGAGSSPVAYTRPITGLASGTTYYYCAIASSTAGTGFGMVLSFTTAGAPTVTTDAPTTVSSTSATLNGSASPNLSAATGWFRYSTSSPGTCNDTFGTRAPASGGTSLGAGSTSVAYAQPITGLAAGTTYYVCAIASNAVGTRFGAVLSFRTPAAPSVTTTAATGVLSTEATLNGTASPNLAATTGWFRYSTTSPGTCNDTFGTRAPTSGGAALGAGSTAVPYSETLVGLTPGTTYYACAIASSAIGTSFGAVISFTTPGAPTVTTMAASAIGSTSATLNGSADPNLSATTAWFRYATTDPGTCDDTFGLRAPASGGTSLGAGSSAAAYAQPLTGLAPGVTYFFCAIAQNAVGTSFGAVLSFTTSAPPAVTTEVATAVTSTGATLNGSASPNGTSATGWFRYSSTDPGSCSDAFGTRAPTSGGSTLGAGASAVAYARTVTGLLPGTTYYYCAIASNAVGTAFGTLETFTTPAAPTVVTEPASAIASTNATLHGSATPNLAAATGWFRYATTSPGTCNDTFGTRAPATGGTALGAGSSAIAFEEPLTGLTPGATYYFCAIASNSVGTRFGAVMSFRTTAAPTVTTEAATAVTSTEATLHGSATPNLTESGGWFRYDTTDPGTCDDTFGTRAPTTVSASLGAGTTPVSYSETLSSLAPGTTYYFCAIASNAAGTGFGAVRTFTTPGAPSVTTVTAMPVAGTTATLLASANPNHAATTGWFRYDTSDPGACDDTFGTRTPATGGTSLGAGSTDTPYSQMLTGLAPATTYWFCAIASNDVGTSFGSVLSLTTPAAPVVTTEAATDVAGDAATLHATANPSRGEATGWFRYDTTDPGTCDDAFGTRAPASGGTSLGAGDTAVPFEEVLAGLAPATTYYFCAIASNAEGTGFGEVLTFSTGATPPTVTTTAPTGVVADGAVLNGAAVGNGDETTAWFRYDTSDPGECDDAFGTRAPASGEHAIGASLAPVAFSETLSGLTTGVTYYACAIAQNALGTAFGEIVSFVPGAIAPDVTTEPAIDVLGTSATLAGTATPNGTDSTGWFRYGDVEPDTCDDSFGTRAPATDGAALGAGADPVAFDEAVTDLAPNTTYYYCAAASNLGGATFGAVVSFTTEAVPPVVRTAEATVGPAGAVALNGAADPRGADTDGWFRWADYDPGTCSDAFGWRAPETGATALGAGRTEATFSQALEGLAPGTYYVCAIGSNEAGDGFGEVVSFVVPETAPMEPGGCGCRVGSRASGGALLPLIGLVLIAIRVRRRRA